MEAGTIDLHTHTSCSDGDYSPADLIKYAANNGVKVIAIADHDTIAAYKTDVSTIAENYGIKLITAIEFSTVDSITGQKIHVVGLNIDINNLDLNKTCDSIESQRRALVLGVGDKLAQLGVKLRVDKLLSSDATVTKNHIGHDVVANPDNKQFFIDKYGAIPLQGRFIEDYLIKGKPAFIDNDKRLNTAQAVQIIKNAGGVAICAHPSFNVMRGLGMEDMISLILRNGFDGVEAINIQYNKSDGDKQFDMVEEFCRFANDNNLLISGGSDFHSEDTKLWGKMSSIGLANEKYHVTGEMVDKILNFRR